MPPSRVVAEQDLDCLIRFVTRSSPGRFDDELEGGDVQRVFRLPSNEVENRARILGNRLDVAIVRIPHFSGRLASQPLVPTLPRLFVPLMIWSSCVLYSAGA